MKIYAHVHGYPPTHNAGAEWMLHNILQDLKRRGHDCIVTAGKGRLGSFRGVFEGVTVESEVKGFKLVRWADVVITHLDKSANAMSLTHKASRPLVHLVHNHRQFSMWGVTPSSCALAVFNSNWLRRAVRFGGPKITVHPPTPEETYLVKDLPGPEDRPFVTLINLTHAKGANLFYDIARRLPDVKFLGVKGGYGKQIIPGVTHPYTMPPNVTVWENRPLVQEIYQQSRLVLMPSSYESWGRVAMEAQCNGIPVIASQTEGLLESLDTAGIFAPRDSPEKFAQVVHNLYTNVDRIREVGQAGRRRYEMVQREVSRQLDELEDRLLEITNTERVQVPAQVDLVTTPRLSPAGETPGVSAIVKSPGVSDVPEPVDFIATKVHFRDHLLPIYRGLPDHLRGVFYLTRPLDDVEDVDVVILPHAHEGKVRVLKRRRGLVVSNASGDQFHVANSGRESVFMEHGSGQSYTRGHSSYAGWPGRKGVVLFLVPGPHPGARNRRAYPNTPVIEVGCPKLDPWINGEKIIELQDPPVVVLSFHWDCKLWSETRSAFSDYQNSLVQFREGLSRRGLILKGHAHPRAQNEFFPVMRRAGLDVIEDFEEVLHTASLYAIDNSSTGFEFAATGRPIVWINASCYRRNVRHSLRFWTHADLGPQVNQPGDFVESVLEGLDDNEEKRQHRRDLLQSVYSVLDGTSTQKVVEAIVEVAHKRRVLINEPRPPTVQGNAPLSQPAIVSFTNGKEEIDMSNPQSFVFLQCLNASFKNTQMVVLVEKRDGRWVQPTGKQRGKVERGQRFATFNTRKGRTWATQIIEEKQLAVRIQTPRTFGPTNEEVPEPAVPPSARIAPKPSRTTVVNARLEPIGPTVTKVGSDVLVEPLDPPEENEIEGEGDGAEPVIHVVKRGGSYYYFSDGERVQGKDSAIEFLVSHGWSSEAAEEHVSSV